MNENHVFIQFSFRYTIFYVFDVKNYQKKENDVNIFFFTVSLFWFSVSISFFFCVHFDFLFVLFVLSLFILTNPFAHLNMHSIPTLLLHKQTYSSLENKKNKPFINLHQLLIHINNTRTHYTNPYTRMYIKRHQFVGIRPVLDAIRCGRAFVM